jgi:hypothetical protein
MRSRVKRQGNIKTNEGNGNVFRGCNGNWSSILHNGAFAGLLKFMKFEM